MPITGDDLAPLYAQFGTMRFGATRFGYTDGRVYVRINGTERATWAAASSKVENLQITETNGGHANRASMRTQGFAVQRYHEVLITLGSTNRLRREFYGAVIDTEESYDTAPGLPNTQVSALDYSWALNRALVTGLYAGAAEDILIALFTTYAPEVSTAKIPTGLPELVISFTKVRLRDAIDRIVKRIGGYWHLDYLRRARVTLTSYPDLTNPVTLTDDLQTLRQQPPVKVKRDRSQQITRVSFEGAGAAALTEVEAGDTILPLAEAPSEWYGDVGGEVIIGESQQILSYTGRVEGGGGSLVGPGVGPSTGAGLALASGVGVTTGIHAVAVVFKTGAGQSLPGPRSVIDVGNVAAPLAGPTAGLPTYGTGPDPGDHYYAITYVTAAGETTASPVSTTITTIAATIADPTTVPTLANGATLAYGSLTPGNSYKVKYTYVDAAGNETLPTTGTATLTINASQRIEVSGVPYSTDTDVVNIRFYISDNGGAGTFDRVYVGNVGGANQFGQISNNTAGGTFTVDIWTLNPGTPTAPTVNSTARRTVPLYGLPVATDALVTARKLYGTAAGGSQLKLIDTLNTTDTTYNVTTIDSGLGANVPTSNTAAANQISLFGVPIGSASVTDREIFMTAANDPSGTLRLALTIANNTATTGTITISDATLAGQAAAPSVDTSGLAQPDGQVARGSTSLLLAGTANFRAAGGWAILNGRQVIRYTGITGSSLTGIPSTGNGSITETVAYSSNVTAAPMLIGIPASGAGAIVNTIHAGMEANLWVTVNNLAAQAEVSALLDPSDALNGDAGIIADELTDSRVSRTEATARAQAHLDIGDDETVEVGYTSVDRNSRAGRTIIIDLEDHLAVGETLAIQSVTISYDKPQPKFTVTASNRRYTFEDLLRQIKESS